MLLWLLCNSRASAFWITLTIGWFKLNQSRWWFDIEMSILLIWNSLGLRLNAKKSVLSPLHRTIYPDGVGFDHDAGTSVSCPDRVDAHCSHESQRRPVTHCQAVSKAAGSDNSCVQHDTFWPAVYETPTAVAQDQRIFPEGKPPSHDHGHAAMPTCLRHVEETLVLVSVPGAGSSLSPHNASDGRIPHWLGSGHEWPPCPHGLWSGRHLTWHINCLQMLAMFRELIHFLTDLRDRHLLVCNRQQCGRLYISHQGGLRSSPLYKLMHNSYVWGSQYGSRHPRGKGDEADMENFWPGSSGFICN